jgi:nitroimidazol reductase NimA-like FMN-containing flavoprotein (pyridoxamine 5'-phosphate oxidase superfamily)
MQQPPRPGDLVTIEPQACVELLEAAPWVRIGFVADGMPSVLPVNVLLHDDAIFFRTAPGSKLGSAAASGTVAVEADGGDEATRIGWSVLARGQASIVTDPTLEEALFNLPFEPWAIPDDNFFWVRVEVESITGRKIIRE